MGETQEKNAARRAPGPNCKSRSSFSYRPRDRSAEPCKQTEGPTLTLSFKQTPHGSSVYVSGIIQCVFWCVLDTNLQDFICFTVQSNLSLFSCSTITGPVGAVWLHSHGQRFNQ